MPFGIGAAVLLILLGALLELPIVVALGLVAAGAALVHELWARRGLDGVEYRRVLERSRVAWGDDIGMTIEVWNGKRLPLAWLRAEDTLTRGVAVGRGSAFAADATTGVLRNTWTLAPFERVRRHVRVTADRRGLFAIGPTALSVGDLFARYAARTDREALDTFIVWPRVVPARGVARAERWGDLDRAHAGLIEDPSRFAGVRSYSPGDPLRRVHSRTSARLGEPMTKRFEPARERQLLIALDVSPRDELGGLAEGGDDDEIEALYVICASLARALAAEGASFGLTAAGFTRSRARFADVPLGRGDGHADRVLDVLARLSNHSSAPFDVLLARIARRYSGATSVLVVTGRDPAQFVGGVRRLGRAGFSVALLCCGPSAAADAERARALGLAARRAVLDGDWRSATGVAVSR